jgi:hypothetical protein
MNERLFNFYKQGVIDQMKAKGFEPNITLNLTLEENPLADKTIRGFSGVQMQYGILEKMFKRFYRFLATESYGCNWRRLEEKHSKFLKLFATIEKGKCGQFHFHCAAVIPAHKTKQEFIDDVKWCWRQQYLSGKRNFHFEEVYDDNGWHSYISKNLFKDGSLGYVSYSKV